MRTGAGTVQGAGVNGGDASELKLLKRNKKVRLKSKSDTASSNGSRRKRFKYKLSDKQKTTLINVAPFVNQEDLVKETELKDPIIRVYSEDSAYVDSKPEDNRTSFRMESMPSQETDFTELRLSSFYSQEEILEGDEVQKKLNVADNKIVDGHNDQFNKTRTILTMSSVASTDVDPFRSQDCLVKHNQGGDIVGKQSMKRYSLCCVNYIVDFIAGILTSDYDSSAGKGNMVPGSGNVANCGQMTGDMTTYIGPRLMANFRGEGRVTTGCLWHSCRAVTIGIALILTGISLTIIGYLTDQREFQEHVELSRKFDNYTSTKYKDGRFHLSNISFSGPVVLGTGGFLVIVACVMTLEARDNAAKIVPATACLETTASKPIDRPSIIPKPRENKFKTSASQTAILDKNIVAVLTGSQSQHSSSTKQKSGNSGTGEKDRRYSSGSAQLPDYSGSSAEKGDHGDVTDKARKDRTEAYVNGDCGGSGISSPGKLHKCPSAPCISLQETRSEVCTIRYQDENQQSNSDKRNSMAQFRVLTPTMYRSRMASTRQTLSMDYSSSVSTTWATNKPAEKLSLRAPVQNEDSLDLELGASATHVDRGRSSKVFLARSNGISQAHDHGQCPDSLQLDLHVEGSGPITLLVRDESRSNKSYQPPESPGHMASSNVCGDTCCPQRNTTVKQVSWGSTSSLANNEMNGEGDWWPGNKLSLPVPPPGILRTSSPHSSSSPGDTNSGDKEPGAGETERSRPCYSLRSDTVLEMCSDIEDISFIDEDPEDEVSEVKREDVHLENNAFDKPSEAPSPQQIVIKLNNDIELTSIVVNTSSGTQSGQEYKSMEEGGNVSLLSHQLNKKTNDVNQSNNFVNQVYPVYDEISETSLDISYDVTLRAPTYESSSSSNCSSSETVSSKQSSEVAKEFVKDQSNQGQIHHQDKGPSSVLMKRRNVLVRQSKLDTDQHPDMTRKRHSFTACHTFYRYPQEKFQLN